MAAIFIGGLTLTKRIQAGERVAAIIAIGSATVFGALAVPFVEGGFGNIKQPETTIGGAIARVVSSVCYCLLVRRWTADDSKRGIAPTASPDALSTSAHS